MMHYGNCHENCGCQQQMQPMQPMQPMPQVQPVVCPAQYRFNDEYTEREVPFIHPIVNVTRHNVIDVPRHYFVESQENVMGTITCGQDEWGGGPGWGGGAGHSPWM